jgi:GntR family transcriptional regulator
MCTVTPADLILSQTDGRPMYLQIIEQIRLRIAVGDWPHGAEIPSIRQLAVALKVSVITVKRAYFELERAGVIVTQQGKGSTVALERASTPRILEDELDRHLAQVVRLGETLTISGEQLCDRLKAAIADRRREAKEHS